MALGEIRDAALQYIEREWPVFPVEPRGKKPLTTHGFKDASTNEDQVRAWWKRWPHANIGCPTGATTFDVVDVDGADGIRSLERLVAKHGELPLGPTQVTGSGGRHLLFAGGTLPTSARRLPGLDTRGAGGYVVMAPSVHRSGRSYEMHGIELELPMPPDWLLDVLGRDRQPALAEDQVGEPIYITDDTSRLMLEMAGLGPPFTRLKEGEGRNVKLFKSACSLRARGQELTGIVTIMHVANRVLCEPALDQDELMKLCASAATYPISETYKRTVKDTVQRAEAKAATESEGIHVEESDLGSVRDLIHSATGVRIDRVIQVGIEFPTYYLALSTGEEVLVGPSISSQKAVGEALIRRLQDPGMSLVSAKRWPVVLKALMRLVEFRGDAEFERREETLGWLRVILLQDRRLQKGRAYQVVKDRRPFTEDGCLYVSSGELLTRLRGQGIPVKNMAEVATRLKEVSRGGSVVLSAREPDGDGIAQTRYWRIQVDAIRPPNPETH